MGGSSLIISEFKIFDSYPPVIIYSTDNTHRPVEDENKRMFIAILFVILKNLKAI